jgi:hypothetical protein
MKRIHSNKLTYVILVSVISLIWFGLSWLSTLMLADESDNLSTVVPTRGLRIIDAIVSFPGFYIGNWDAPPAGFSDRQFAMLGLTVMLINSVIWGIVLALTLKFTINHFLRRRKSSTGT